MPSSSPFKPNPKSKATALDQRPPLSPPWYYRAVIGMLKPLYRVQVWRRSSGRDNYSDEVNQRFGHRYPPAPSARANDSKIIWCHAVSLGETNTAAPLLKALLTQGYQIWLTNTTQTGFARGASLFSDDIKAGRVSHSYVPVDSPAVIERFLEHVQPITALFIETELWANILAQLSRRRIPSILVNARLSQASFSRYQKIGAVSASMMQNLTLIIAQDMESAKRFRQLGAKSSQIRVAGSLKWAVNTPKLLNNDNRDNNDENKESSTDQNCDVKTSLASVTRPIWVAASTHSDEESVALAWHQQLLADTTANPLLIIVPRHPERFDEVAELITASNLQMARRSLDEAIDASTQVFLADSMGELMRWYEAADVALVGGSLVDIGGHNPVEASSVATPVLMGRFTQSCQSVVDQLASVGALYQPHNAHYNTHPQASEDSQTLEDDFYPKTDTNDDDNALIFQQLQFWLDHLDKAKKAGQAGKALAIENQSVLTRQLTMITDVLNSQKVQL